MRGRAPWGSRGSAGVRGLWARGGKGGAAPLGIPGGSRRGAGPRGTERVSRRGVSRDGGRGRPGVLETRGSGSGEPGPAAAGWRRPRALSSFPGLRESDPHRAPADWVRELLGAGVGAGSDPRSHLLVSATSHPQSVFLIHPSSPVPSSSSSQERDSLLERPKCCLKGKELQNCVRNVNAY